MHFPKVQLHDKRKKIECELVKFIGVVETIVSKFINGKVSKNVKNKHLCSIIAIRGKRSRKKLEPIILFFEKDYILNLNHNHDNLMVITTTNHNYLIKRILSIKLN